MVHSRPGHQVKDTVRRAPPTMQIRTNEYGGAQMGQEMVGQEAAQFVGLKVL